MNDALAIVEREMAPAPPALFGTDDPRGIVRRATEVAQPLADVINDRKLYTDISGRRHVTIGGWTLLGSMLGVFPVTAWCRAIERGWEARVEARTLGGALVGAAEAQCTDDEPNWKPGQKSDNQRRSMAQTRAASKALRMPLGFVMTLAGYDATPAEEMDGAARSEPLRVTAPQRPQSKTPIEGTARPSASVTPEQQAELRQQVIRLGITNAMVTQLAIKNYGSKVSELSAAGIANLIADLAEYQTAADVQGALAEDVEPSDPDDVPL